MATFNERAQKLGYVTQTLRTGLILLCRAEEYEAHEEQAQWICAPNEEDAAELLQIDALLERFRINACYLTYSPLKDTWILINAEKDQDAYEWKDRPNWATLQEVAVAKGFML